MHVHILTVLWHDVEGWRVGHENLRKFDIAGSQYHKEFRSMGFVQFEPFTHPPHVALAIKNAAFRRRIESKAVGGVEGKKINVSGFAPIWNIDRPLTPVL